MLATMLGPASDLRPFKYDHFLYGIDVRFGAAISFVVGSVFEAQPLIGRMESVVYDALPFPTPCLPCTWRARC
jgi:hypothetical protein